MAKPIIHAGNIECAVASLLNFRVYTIVPNVSHGLYLNHECDMLALDSKGRFTEIEIKISVSDLKADFKKKHSHSSKIISRLVYAMPDFLCEKYNALIPKQFGIISVKCSDGRFIAKWFRPCKHDNLKQKPSDSVIKNFMRLGCMRIWSLKKHNYSKSYIQ